MQIGIGIGLTGNLFGQSAPVVGVAPSITAAASVAETDGGATITYSFTPPVVAGTPTPSVSRVLTMAGVNVTGSMAGDDYVATKTGATQALVMTYTASNGVSPNATSTVSRTVPVAPVVNVAPSITAAASVAEADGGLTVTYTFTPPVVSGTPTPTVTRVLTLGGADVTAAMSGNVYVATKTGATQALVMTYTASNGTLPNATSVVSRTVAAAAQATLTGGTINLTPDPDEISYTASHVGTLHRGVAVAAMTASQLLAGNGLLYRSVAVGTGETVDDLDLSSLPLATYIVSAFLDPTDAAVLSSTVLTTVITGGTAVATPVTAIAADGWRATYPTPPTFDVIGAPETIPVTRQGFNAAAAGVTLVENVPINGRLRQPFPNQATLTADTVVLSDFVHAADTLPAGVTNNSTRAYPNPIATWLEPDYFPITEATFTVNLMVAHKFARGGRPVAAVRIIASDGTTTREVLVSSLTFNSYAATGLGVDSYRASFTSADFAAGVPVTVDAIIYPWVGSAYQLSVNGNAAPNMKNCTIQGYRVTPMFAYVSASGNNTTGVASTTAATAAANPCLTIAGAATKIRAANLAAFGRDEIGGGVIRFPVGTWVLGATDAGTAASHPITTACLVYESINPADKATTILTDNGATKSGPNMPRHAIIRNVTLRKSGAAGSIIRHYETTPATLVLQNCTLDQNSQAGDATWINRKFRIWVIDCEDVSGSTATLSASSTLLTNGVAIGYRMGFSGNCAISQIACRMRNVSITTRSNVSLGFAQGMIVNSVITGNTGGFAVSIDGGFLATAGLGFAMVGNIVETFGAGAGSVYTWADGNTSVVNGFLFDANTLPGASDETRFNRPYSDVAGATGQKDMAMRFNVMGRSACKIDVFAASGAAIGAWPVAMGVGHSFNSLTEGRTPPNANIGAGSWRFELLYPGIQIGDGGAGVLNPLWTTDNSFTGANIGGGDYRPQAGSPLIRIPAGRTITARDLFGQTIPTNGTAFIGAAQAA